MKWLTIMLIIVLLIPIVYSQANPAPPQDTSNAEIMQKIDQEHKNTRKFVSDELTRQREAWVAQIDDRANYYEVTANNLIQTATWKFGLVWAGVTFFIISINALLRARIERKKYDKLKKALVGETTEQMMAQINVHQQNLDKRFQQIQAETQSSIQNQFQKIQRHIAETQPQRRQEPEPPLMDYDGRPIKQTFAAPQQQFRTSPAQSSTASPKVTFEQLQQLMRQYGLKPQESPMQPLFQQEPVPTPPPMMMPPAPRKLGFFERRKEAKLQAELAKVQKYKAMQENKEATLKGELYKLNPFG